ncbi:MAG TPA: YceI family protein [Alphaproteobacteria bacterium]|jgi:polyisoprenoid-binding protein YceI
MKIRTLCTAAALAALAAAPAAADTFRVDPFHSSFVFSANHIGYTDVFGLFREWGGEFSFDPKEPEKTRVKIEVKTESLDTNDHRVQAQGGVRGRNEHLRSADFFNVKEFPSMTFESTKVEKTGEKTAKLHGNVTLLGVTKPVVFDVTFNKVAPHPVPAYKGVMTAGFTIRGTIKRSDWGMKFGVPAVSDEVALYIQIEAQQKN